MLASSNQQELILRSFPALTRSSRSLYVNRCIFVGTEATDSIMVERCFSQAIVERIFVLLPRVLRPYTSSPQLELVELCQHLVFADLALKPTHWRIQGGQKSLERIMTAGV
jgi:hypothetical protein